MRALIAISVLLAAVATALVGVHEHAENRRLQYRVWEAMRMRDHLTKQMRELETAIDGVLSPKRLLEERDRRLAVSSADAAWEGDE